MTRAVLNFLNDKQDCFSRPEKACYRCLLVFVILIGLGVRLAAIYYTQGYHHFMVNDEVNALHYVLAWLAGDEQARYLAQPRFNEGQLPGPLWTVFGVALFKLGGSNAEGMLYWMAAANSLTVIAVYLLARYILGPSLALLGAALYAIAPWTVYYSYGLYNPVPLDLIGALLFLALWQTINRPQSRQIFWVPLLCAVIPQFHMFGIFLIPAVLIVLLLSARTLNWRWLAPGIIAGLLLYLPYLIGDMQNGWQNLQAMTRGGEERAYSASVLKIITAPATVLSSVPAGWSGDGTAPIRAFGEHWFGHFAVLGILAGWTLLHSFVFLFHLLKQFASSWRHAGFRPGVALRADTPVVFIGLMLLVPLLLFLPTGHNFSTRYATVLFPLLFMLPGLFLQNLQRFAVIKYWFIALILTGLFNLYLLGSYYAHQQQRFAGGEEFMPSFRTLETIRQQLQADAGSGTAFEVILSPDLRQKLSHFDHKLVYTVSQYTRYWQQDFQDRDGPPAVTYVIEYAEQPMTTSALYRRGRIAIFRQTER